MFKRKNVKFMIKFHLKASHNIRLSATKSKKQQETPKGQYRKKTILKEKRMHSLQNDKRHKFHKSLHRKLELHDPHKNL